MKFRQKNVGWKSFDGSVDITDPCYDKDVLYRMNAVKIKQGEYLCATWMYVKYGKYADKRVAVIGIYLDGIIPDEDDLVMIGQIGVDAGLAGFFHNKPDFDDSIWDKFCNDLGNKRSWLTELGFWSESGFGDGQYNVFAQKDENGEIIAVEIKFM